MTLVTTVTMILNMTRYHHVSVDTDRKVKRNVKVLFLDLSILSWCDKVSSTSINQPFIASILELSSRTSDGEEFLE